jgi:hypothetical protein
MKLFEIAFVTIAKEYIKVWKKYQYWSVGVRYFIALMFFFNYLSLFLILDKLPSFELFMLGLAFSYFFLQFYRPEINTKEFVENYHLTKRNKQLVLLYLIISVVSIVALFLIRVVYK